MVVTENPNPEMRPPELMIGDWKGKPQMEDLAPERALGMGSRPEYAAVFCVLGSFSGFGELDTYLSNVPTCCNRGTLPSYRLWARKQNWKAHKSEAWKDSDGFMVGAGRVLIHSRENFGEGLVTTEIIDVM